ncbi:hypothetical protein [Saccharopolyspora hattusasensis]|uniref:hypothetical protein n=1 Tax=Saccharopolyspora hattusasensis TaxID=1128679 RepID=UPI003D9661D7
MTTHATDIAQHILTSDISIPELDVAPSPGVDPVDEIDWGEKGDKRLFVLTDGWKMAVNQPTLTKRQKQDVTLSQWFAGRRAAYEINRQYGIPRGETADKKPEEFFGIFRDEIGGIGWDLSSFVATKYHYQNSENDVPEFLKNQLSSIGGSPDIQKACKDVRDWADQGKPNAKLFARKESPMRMVGKEYGDSFLHDDNLRFRAGFFSLDANMDVKDWLVFQVKNTDVKLWTFRGTVSCSNGSQLTDEIHDALVKKYNSSGKGNIDGGKI